MLPLPFSHKKKYFFHFYHSKLNGLHTKLFLSFCQWSFWRRIQLLWGSVFPCNKLKLFVTTRTNLMSSFWGQKDVKEGKTDCRVWLEKNVVPISISQDRCRELKQTINCNHCIMTTSYSIWKPMREKAWKGRLQMAAVVPAKSFSGSGLKPRKRVTRDHVHCYHVHRKLSSG